MLCGQKGTYISCTNPSWHFYLLHVYKFFKTLFVIPNVHFDNTPNLRAPQIWLASDSVKDLSPHIHRQTSKMHACMRCAITLPKNATWKKCSNKIWRCEIVVFLLNQNYSFTDFAKKNVCWRICFWNFAAAKVCMCINSAYNNIWHEPNQKKISRSILRRSNIRLKQVSCMSLIFTLCAQF